MPLAQNITFLVDGYSIADALTTFSPEGTMDELDATVLANDFRSYESGFKEGRLTTEGLYQFDSVTLDKIHTIFKTAFSDGVARAVTASFGAVTVGVPA